MSSTQRTVSSLFRSKKLRAGRTGPRKANGGRGKGGVVVAQTSKRRVRTRQSLEDGATTTTTTTPPPSTTAAAAALGAPSPTKRQRRTSLRSQIGHSPVHLPPPPPSPPVPTPAAVAAAVTPPQQSTAASRSRLARSPTNLERRFTATSSALAASPVRTTAAQRAGRLTAAQRAAQTTAAQRAAQIAAAQRAERTLRAKGLLQRTRFNVGGGRTGLQAAPARRRRGNAALTAAIGAASTPAIGGRAGHKRALTPAERQVAAARNVPANDTPRAWAARSSLAPSSSRSSGGAAGAGVGARPRSSASQTVRVIPEKQEAIVAKAKQLMGRHNAGRPLPHHLERLEQVMKAVDLALVSRAQTVPQPVTVIAQSVARTVGAPLMNVLPLLCGLYDSAQQSRPYTFSYRNSGELHMHADIPRGRRDNVAAGWLEQRKVDVRKLLLDYVANHERAFAVGNGLTIPNPNAGSWLKEFNIEDVPLPPRAALTPTSTSRAHSHPRSINLTQALASIGTAPSKASSKAGRSSRRSSSSSSSSRRVQDSVSDTKSLAGLSGTKLYNLTLQQKKAACRRYAAEKERKTVDSAGGMMQIVVPHLGVLRPQQKFQLGEVVEGVVRSMKQAGTSVSKDDVREAVRSVARAECLKNSKGVPWLCLAGGYVWRNDNGLSLEEVKQALKREWESRVHKLKAASAKASKGDS